MTRRRAPLVAGPVTLGLDELWRSAARFGVVAAASVVAIASQGDAVLLVALLVALQWRPGGVGALAIAAAGGALLGAAVRWGSTSLEAIAGAQAVLGPAAWTGDTASVAAAWLGGAALLTAVPAPGWLGSGREDLLASVPAGAAAALVAVGPGPGGPLWLRALVTIVAVLAARVLVVAAAAPDRIRWLHLDTMRRAGAVAGLAALLAAIAGR